MDTSTEIVIERVETEIPQQAEQGGNQEAADQIHESGASISNHTKPLSLWATKTARLRIGLLDKTLIPELDDITMDTLGTKFRGNEDALTAYLEMAKKMLISDKGFKAECLNHPTLTLWVNANKWQSFAKHNNKSSHWELVREFVANMNGSPCGTTWIRGVKVLYDAKTINELYDLEDIPGGVTYNDMNARGPRLKADQERVTRMFTKDGSDPEFVTDKTLKTEMAPVVDFFHSKIKPGGNVHMFTQILLRGVVELWQGKPFRIGEIIEQTLFSKKNGKGVLCYPNLIRQLCEKAGVDLEPFSTGKIIEFKEPLPVPELPGIDEVPLSVSHRHDESGDHSVTRKPLTAQKRKRTKAKSPKRSKKQKTKEPSKQKSAASEPAQELDPSQQEAVNTEKAATEEESIEELKAQIARMSAVIARLGEAIANLEKRHEKRERRHQNDRKRAMEINQSILKMLQEMEEREQRREERRRKKRKKHASPPHAQELDPSQQEAVDTEKAATEEESIEELKAQIARMSAVIARQGEVTANLEKRHEKRERRHQNDRKRAMEINQSILKTLQEMEEREQRREERRRKKRKKHASPPPPPPPPQD